MNGSTFLLILQRGIYYNIVERQIEDMMPKLILVFVFAIYLAQSQSVCNNCLNSACNFTCYGQQCQSYTFNSTCQNNPCYATFYPIYTTNTMNVTSCVACNYTYPGCVLCNTNNCNQCQADYYLLGSVCYNRNGTPVGAVPYMEGIAIAFVVLFGVFGCALLVLKGVDLKNRK